MGKMIERQLISATTMRYTIQVSDIELANGNIRYDVAVKDHNATRNLGSYVKQLKSFLVTSAINNEYTIVPDARKAEMWLLNKWVAMSQ